MRPIPDNLIAHLDACEWEELHAELKKIPMSTWDCDLTILHQLLKCIQETRSATDNLENESDFPIVTRRSALNRPIHDPKCTRILEEIAAYLYLLPLEQQFSADHIQNFYQWMIKLDASEKNTLFLLLMQFTDWPARASGTGVYDEKFGFARPRAGEQIADIIDKSLDKLLVLGGMAPYFDMLFQNRLDNPTFEQQQTLPDANTHEWINRWQNHASLKLSRIFINQLLSFLTLQNMTGQPQMMLCAAGQILILSRINLLQAHIQKAICQPELCQVMPFYDNLRNTFTAMLANTSEQANEATIQLIMQRHSDSSYFPDDIARYIIQPAAARLNRARPYTPSLIEPLKQLQKLQALLVEPQVQNLNTVKASFTAFRKINKATHASISISLQTTLWHLINRRNDKSMASLIIVQLFTIMPLTLAEMLNIALFVTKEYAKATDCDQHAKMLGFITEKILRWLLEIPENEISNDIVLKKLAEPLLLHGRQKAVFQLLSVWGKLCVEHNHPHSMGAVNALTASTSTNLIKTLIITDNTFLLSENPAPVVAKIADALSLKDILSQIDCNVTQMAAHLPVIYKMSRDPKYEKSPHKEAFAQKRIEYALSTLRRKSAFSVLDSCCKAWSTDQFIATLNMLTPRERDILMTYTLFGTPLFKGMWKDREGYLSYGNFSTEKHKEHFDELPFLIDDYAILYQNKGEYELTTACRLRHFKQLPDDILSQPDMFPYHANVMLASLFCTSKMEKNQLYFPPAFTRLQALFSDHPFSDFAQILRDALVKMINKKYFPSNISGKITGILNKASPTPIELPTVIETQETITPKKQQRTKKPGKPKNKKSKGQSKQKVSSQSKKPIEAISAATPPTVKANENTHHGAAAESTEETPENGTLDIPLEAEITFDTVTRLSGTYSPDRFTCSPLSHKDDPGEKYHGLIKRQLTQTQQCILTLQKRSNLPEAFAHQIKGAHETAQQLETLFGWTLTKPSHTVELEKSYEIEDDIIWNHQLANLCYALHLYQEKSPDNTEAFMTGVAELNHQYYLNPTKRLPDGFYKVVQVIATRLANHDLYLQGSAAVYQKEMPDLDLLANPTKQIGFPDMLTQLQQLAIIQTKYISTIEEYDQTVQVIRMDCMGVRVDLKVLQQPIDLNLLVQHSKVHLTSCSATLWHHSGEIALLPVVAKALYGNPQRRILLLLKRNIPVADYPEVAGYLLKGLIKESPRLKDGTTRVSPAYGAFEQYLLNPEAEDAQYLKCVDGAVGYVLTPHRFADRPNMIWDYIQSHRLLQRALRLVPQVYAKTLDFYHRHFVPAGSSLPLQADTDICMTMLLLQWASTTPDFATHLVLFGQRVFPNFRGELGCIRLLRTLVTAGSCDTRLNYLRAWADYLAKHPEALPSLNQQLASRGIAKIHPRDLSRIIVISRQYRIATVKPLPQQVAPQTNMNAFAFRQTRHTHTAFSLEQVAVV